jgi:hypothetical protein
VERIVAIGSSVENEQICEPGNGATGRAVGLAVNTGDARATSADDTGKTRVATGDTSEAVTGALRDD